VEYCFFDAIRGDRGYECFEGYDHRQTLINMGREASAGEIGCYASHRSLWKRCVSDNEPIVIMEDDAKIQAGFLPSLRKVERLIPGYGFIRLQSEGPNRQVRAVPVEMVGQSVLYYYQAFPYGAMCYAIAPEVAASFIDKSHVFTGPVDLFIKRFWDHGQPLFALSPHSVEGGVLRKLSTINGRVKERRGISFAVLRALNKVKGRISRERFNVEYRRRIERHRERDE